MGPGALVAVALACALGAVLLGRLLVAGGGAPGDGGVSARPSDGADAPGVRDDPVGGTATSGDCGATDAGAAGPVPSLEVGGGDGGQGLQGQASPTAGDGSPQEGGVAAPAGELPQGWPGAEVTRRRSAQALADEARDVLSAYRDRGDCALASCGYLDAFGRVWSCTGVDGRGVEMQVLREGASGGTEVVAIRMDARDWAGDAAGSGEAAGQEG